MLKIVTSPDKFSLQEQAYLSLRRKEGRIYSDAELQKLPIVPKNHPLAKEWKVRKDTSGKLVNYLTAKNKPLQVLEIGCGNGWLCNTLSQIENSYITGLDVNKVELEQAAKVFPNIEFVYGDIFENIFRERKFDIIVFAASIQYFQNITTLLERVKLLLSTGGEIHIIDCPFYASDKASLEAKERSVHYFKTQGFPDMAQYYNHHTFSTLQKFNPRVIKPTLYEHLLGLSYFPWVIIQDL